VADGSKKASAQVTLYAVSINLSPGSVALLPSQTAQFSTTVSHASYNGVTWTLSPNIGSMSASGLYTAPPHIPVGQTITVTATSVADNTKSATATINLIQTVEISVSPNSLGDLYPGQSTSYVATLIGSNQGVVWSRSPAVGSVTGNINGVGTYSAPAALDSNVTVTITATSVSDPSKSVSVQLVVHALNPWSVTVSPASSLVGAGQSVQFSAAVINRATQTVNWSISPQVGSITSAGLYTPPAAFVPQAVTVTAASVLDPAGHSASATIWLARPMPSGLAAWWPGDAGVTDVVSGAAGISNGCVSIGGGQVNAGFSVECGGNGMQSSSPGSISGARTFAAWVKPRSGAPLTTLSASGDGFGIYDHVLRFQHNGGSYNDSSAWIPQDVWTHVAVVYDGAAIQFYVNGAAAGSNSAGMNDYALNAIQIGFASGGALDEIQVYNRALSAAEVAQAMAPIAVTVTPPARRVYGGQTQQFAAAVANNANLSGAVTWSINPAVGSISGSGLYTGPATISTTQTVTVTATSVADPGRTGSATVTLSPPVAVSIAAGSAMSPSQMQQFVATVSNADDTSVTWSMVSGPGAINTAGWYTSPISVSGPVSATVKATSTADPTKSAMATITVNPWSAGTPYQYYLSEPFNALDAGKWQGNGSIAVGPSGLSGWSGGGGSVVSKVAVADGTSDYEAQMTVHLTNPVQTWGANYAVLGRASQDAVIWNGGTFYAFAMLHPWYDSTGCSAQFSLYKKTSSGLTEIASFPHSCRDGMVMRMVMRGSQILVGIDADYRATFTDTELTSGMPGVSFIPAAGTTISNVKLGAADNAAPPAPSSPAVSLFPNKVEVQWPATLDGAGESGVWRYQVYRRDNGQQNPQDISLGMVSTGVFRDEAASAGASYTYKIYSIDYHGNVSAGFSSFSAAVPTTYADQRRVGVRPSGTYWGAAGEQIDLLSGNLNFTVPLLKPQARGGWGPTFGLSYNSQMWRKDNGGTWRLGQDVGYGLGWKLQAGSITPVFFNSNLLYCIFTDATGAEYRLDQNSGGVWTSREGVYLAYDANSKTLRFPDGSFWVMGSESAAAEDDGGTLYPTMMQDTNGNQIQIQYKAGLGATTVSTSARLDRITDPRAASGSSSYQFTYNTDAIPHLTSIVNSVSTAESYGFGYGTTALTSPFNPPVNYPTASVLTSATVTGLGIGHGFEYNGSGEMTRMITPLGGDLRWSYSTYTYTNATLGPRSFREVTGRQMTPISGGSQMSWTIATDANATLHASATVTDAGANASKVWGFGSNGSAASFEERGPAVVGGASVTLLRKEYTWTQDAAGTPYIGSVLTKVNPGSGSEVRSRSDQTLDTHGNLTQSKAYEFHTSTPTLARTYDYTYVTDSNYTSRWIWNRLSQATVTPAGGGAVTLATNTYDNPQAGAACNLGGLTARTGLPLHDDAGYGAAMRYRGNVTYTSGVSGAHCFDYETTGVVTKAMDGVGNTVEITPSAATSYGLPAEIKPGGNASLETSMTYAASFAVASMTGPNGATSTTTYDTYGRPTQTTIPDGAQTNYAYTYYPSEPNTQTATLGTRWKKTTLDGFGRVIKVESGHDSTTVSVVDSEYAACACSPTGKLYRVSQPHAPGAGAVWTTYSYDGVGRTLRVVAPDGSTATTEYLTAYGGVAGSFVKSTDPAGKWKVQRSDAMGNLVTVYEPNPAGGSDWTTSYTYSVLGQLLTVTMPRSNGTQTRTFVYNGVDLVSATNPENGTVTYEYDAAHHVTKRTDAKGQETRYTYDQYGRLTNTKHYVLVSGVMTEQTAQSVEYYYDASPHSANAAGRLAQVRFYDGTQIMAYEYSYNTAGRVTDQRLAYDGLYIDTDLSPHVDAHYSWDSEGRLFTLEYPSSGPLYVTDYDNMGRQSGMRDLSQAGGPTVATASYGVAGEVTELTYFGYTEGRTYNSLLQLTGMTANVTGSATKVMDMVYNYTAAANNGRIGSSVDGVMGETVNYSYDALNRLSLAQTSVSVDAVSNLAQGKTATQSSTYTTANASLAVDGNTDGDFGHGSVSITNSDANAWWQVDLGGTANVSNVEIWNRTDGSGDRLSDYWVFISNTPFSATDTPATLAGKPGVWRSHQTSQPNPNVMIAAAGAVGRYVRVQLSGTNYLQLAEVKVNGTLGWGQSYSYDGFGNLTGKAVTKGSAPSLSVSFDAATNRQVGVSYDANGNVNGTYDVENRLLVGPGGEQYIYDHQGKRVIKRKAGGTAELYFYGVNGQKLATYACTASGQFGALTCGSPAYHVYFKGKLVKSGSQVVVTDRLGSVRANSGGESLAYFPYGEERGSSADGREKFGTYMRDGVGQDYADQRYYGVGTGRFFSPDPYRALLTSPIDSANPASWNRYSYVQGDPVNSYDPSGLLLAAPGEASTICGPHGLFCEGPDDFNYGFTFGFGTGDDGNSGGGSGGGGHEDDRTRCEIDAATIDNYISATPIFGNAKLSKPLAGMGNSFIDAALQYDTNPAVVVGIGFWESHWGYDQRNSGNNNAFGLLHADGSFLTFDSWEDGIFSATKTVDSAYDRGKMSVSDLYSGAAGGYCTGKGCSNAIKTIEQRVRGLGEDPNYLGFDCDLKDGVLVKKQ
jgi:RHS repeat-associated protein